MSLSKEILVNSGPIRCPLYLRVLFALYLFLSFFEQYTSALPVGNITKYLIFLLIGLLLVHYRGRMRFGLCGGMMAAWLALRIASLLWSDGSNINQVQINALSIMGMTLFYVVATSLKFDKSFTSFLVEASLAFSVLFGLLSLVFAQPYLGVESRKVLTLFGAQSDPNNCAAIMLIGFSIAAYRLLVQRRYSPAYVVGMLVNCVAILQTASRGGLVSIAIVILVLAFLPEEGERRLTGARTRRAIVILLGFFVAAYLVSTILSVASFERLFRSDYGDGSGRMDIWGLAVDYFLSSPLFGCGWGGYSFAVFGAGVSHNTYLSILCDTGIVGFVMFSIPVIATVRISAKRRDWLPILLLTSVLAPVFFFEAINKRFFWNALILSYLVATSCSDAVKSDIQSSGGELLSERKGLAWR